MTTENLYLESWSTNTGLLTPANGLNNGAGNWTTNVDSEAWNTVGEFANPVGNHANGTHSFNIRARKDAGTNNPTLTMEIISATGVVLGTTGAVSITSTTGQTVSLNISAATLNAASGGLNGIKAKLTAPATGGSPSARSVVQIDYCFWSGDFDTVTLGPSVFVFESGTELAASIFVWNGTSEVPISSIAIT